MRCVMAVNETRRDQRMYCLYTDSLFAGGQGVSLITTPHTAADTLGADALEDRPYHGGSRKRSYLPGPVVNAEGPAYSIEQTPGKGLGVVAKRKIRQGEIIMLDFAALIVGKMFLEDTEPRLRRRVLKRGIAQLPESTQEKIFALAKSTGGEEIDDILGTNTCSVKLGSEESHLGLFPEVSVSSLLDISPATGLVLLTGGHHAETESCLQSKVSNRGLLARQGNHPRLKSMTVLTIGSLPTHSPSR